LAAAPVAETPAAGGSPTVKRPADTAAETEEHKCCRLALDRVADEWLCPITKELPLDPVMAEDLRFYERASIEEWFRRNESAIRSPVANTAMGQVLKAVPQVRNTIQSLVDSGAITGDRADSWSKRLAQEEKVRRMRERATAGDLEAMLVLGVCYEVGTSGLQKDGAQAFAWYQRSAGLGDVRAMAHLGRMYCKGTGGVGSNVGLGAARLGRAAALGYDWACYELGRYHESGCCGFGKDPDEASFYYSKIPCCTIKHLGSDDLAKAAEWVRAHPVLPTADH
jgi:TPR repeat protein